MKTIRKAVFPVAGLGTRFLPATKANPKEMLPIVDKPLIQYAAEEAVEAGIDTLIFIIGRNKRSIADHFDKAFELEYELEAKNKEKLLALARDVLPPHVNCIYIRQAEALGLGHAVLCSAAAVGDEPFAVILADDLVKTDGANCMQQMVNIYDEYHGSVLGTETIDIKDSSKYGMVAGPKIFDGLSEVQQIVEKPQPSVAPSNQAVIGRYILTPRIFDKLRTTGRGAGGEIQLTDGIAALCKEEKVYAYSFKGHRYDCGSKLGYLQATVDFALEHPEVKTEFAEYLKSLRLK
ncbi:MAG TPA: UTP--glucose-1-phosphate uridylyltransferase GalU [Gammaproteobacteria bacterium]|nr:UTP--glucose-1-phosphate uridylyltransferase GalU [Gammaproteobacteria bacterium]